MQGVAVNATTIPVMVIDATAAREHEVLYVQYKDEKKNDSREGRT
jgi:hypothetical protein